MCRPEFGFRERSYTVFFDDLGDFITAQWALCTIFLTFLFLKLESCNLVCRREFGFREHSFSSVSSDLNVSFKRPQKKKHLLRVSLKSVENWKNGSQMCL